MIYIYIYIYLGSCFGDTCTFCFCGCCQMVRELREVRGT